MEVERVRAQGLQMWHCAVEVAIDRVNHGRKFALEQPAFASSWSMYSTDLLSKMPGVMYLESDMCAAAQRNEVSMSVIHCTHDIPLALRGVLNGKPQGLPIPNLLFRPSES